MPPERRQRRAEGDPLMGAVVDEGGPTKQLTKQHQVGNYAVAVFWDVENGFSHTSPHIICEEAASRGVPRPIVDWMLDLLDLQADNLHLRKLSVLRNRKREYAAGGSDLTGGLGPGGRQATQVAQRWRLLSPGLRGQFCCGQPYAVHVEKGNHLVYGDGA